MEMFKQMNNEFLKNCNLIILSIFSTNTLIFLVLCNFSSQNMNIIIFFLDFDGNPVLILPLIVFSGFSTNAWPAPIGPRFTLSNG